MRLRTAMSVSLVLSLALAAADRTQSLNVKLGLWQMTYTTARSGAVQLQTIRPELLAKMSPEQRARTEARLKARAAQGPQADTRKYCLTEEKLKKAVFDDGASKSCQRAIITSTSKVQQFHEECTERGTKRTADGRFEALDSGTMKGSLKIRAEGNTTSTMSMDIAGKWVGGDCGDVAQ